MKRRASSPLLDAHWIIQQAISRSPNPKIGPEKLAIYVPKTLSYLVACATAHATTSYARVAEVIGAGSPQNGNWAFGSIAWILRLLEETPKFSATAFPDITAIVANKNSATAGRGAFLSDEGMLNKDKAAKIAWLEARRASVFRFGRWPEVLSYLSITPMSDLGTSSESLKEFAERTSRATGEGPEHLEIKNWVAANPNAVTVFEGEIQEVVTEFLFWSLDRLDIFVRTDLEWVGIEIKPSSSDPDEVRRGLYQVIKYKALLQAELLAEGSSCSPRCLLVLGGRVPKELGELARRLGIIVTEDVRALMV